MKLGFYYHIPFSVNSDNKILVPSYFGLFIDSLARNVEHLYCFLHEVKLNNQMDYNLIYENISIITLGKDAPAYIKTFFPNIFFSKEVKYIATICDYILVRGPSPMLHHFKSITTPNKIVYFIVGSYQKGLIHIEDTFIRTIAIQALLKYIHTYQQEVIRNSRVLVNSVELLEDYKHRALQIDQVYTTTLTESDFYFREDTCYGDIINIYYIGRFDWAKGLRELLEAFLHLTEIEANVMLNFVGWEDASNKPVENEIKLWSSNFGIDDKILFHGKMKVGHELFMSYRNADIYVLPSYHEGFPRTIWEAMASSVPVIATKVGSIPQYLTHLKNVFLIEPHNVNEILNAFKVLICNSHIRKTLIKGGIERVRNITLEKQAIKIIRFIENE